MRNKPIANPVMLAKYKSKQSSIFEKGPSSASHSVGRYE
jgi:hypothetical protein